MSTEELKNKAKTILGECKIQVLSGEPKIIEILEKIEKGDFTPEEKEIKIKVVESIEEYLCIKEKEMTKKRDTEYLKNIAEILRNQQVRVEDGVYLKSPVFKVTINANEDNDEETFFFLTKEGADKFIESNKVLSKDLRKEKIEKTTENDRRKEQLFKVELNRNLELERLIEIIKRNF